MQQSFITKTSRFFKDYWAMLIAITVGGIALYIAVKYAMQPLLERHSFRQTQTALTTFWMQKNGWEFAYETPVGGYPWKLPFEFPIYQAIVAFISSAFNTSLSATGRLVSFSFLVGCAYPIFKISKKLELKTSTPWVICALLWSSPLYLFWGRTFMIEMSTVFFALMTLKFGLGFFKHNPTFKTGILFTLFATLGMLQKITTVAPVILILSVCILVHHLRTMGMKFPPIRKILLVFFSFLIPIILALSWVKFTDQIKEESLFGNMLTSTALSKWNYGPLEMRTDTTVLQKVFWDRVISNNIAGYAGLGLLFLGLIFSDKKSRILIGLCLGLFVLPILIFLNLHQVHDYYQTSSTLFLIIALAIAITTILPKITIKLPLLPIVVIGLVSYNLYCFTEDYQKSTVKQYKTNQDRALIISEIIKNNTSENDAAVVFGYDWSSVISYYSERKTFTVPPWFRNYDSVYRYPQNFIGDKQLGAVVFKEHDSLLPSLMERKDILKDSSLFKVQPHWYIWLPGVKRLTSPKPEKSDEFENVFKFKISKEK